MKSITPLILLLSLLSGLAAQSTDTTMTMTFQVTTSSPGGTYSPRNIGAIWVEDASGSFVKTLRLWASQRRQYLYTWNSHSNGNTVDGVTGATYSSHGTRTASWDFTDLTGNLVPPGNYTLWLELTDQHSQGPRYSFNFPYMGATETIIPPQQGIFHNMQLRYDVTMVVGLDPKGEICPNTQTLLQAFPNPFNPSTAITCQLQEARDMDLSIYDLRGQRVIRLKTGLQQAGDHTFFWNGRDQNQGRLPAGIYVCCLALNEKTYSLKLSLLN